MSQYTNYGNKNTDVFRCKICNRYISAREIDAKRMLQPFPVYKKSIEDFLYCKRCENDKKRNC